MRYSLLILLILTVSLVAQDGIKTEVVEYTHQDKTLQGFFAYDSEIKGKRAGILVVHEWRGHNDYVRKRARQLATMGYIAFALDMYGKGVLAKNSQEASKLAGQFYDDRQLMRNRAAAGLQVLKEHPLTDTSNLAAIGFCFGGTTVLELARSGADLEGFVSFHGGLSTPDTTDSHNIQGSVLILHGADDPFVPTKEVLTFQEEMRNAHVDWQMNIYGGAVHSFTNPASGSNKSSGAAYHEKAAKRAWRDMQQFFNEIFK